MTLGTKMFITCMVGWLFIMMSFGCRPDYINGTEPPLYKIRKKIDEKIRNKLREWYYE